MKLACLLACLLPFDDAPVVAPVRSAGTDWMTIKATRRPLEASFLGAGKGKARLGDNSGSLEAEAAKEWG